ncbi:MAG: histidine kinase dimerization/phospho-acceptor domain-containing protein [Caldilineaceae bacterium]
MIVASAILQAFPEPTTLVDPQGTILDLNQAYCDYAARLGVQIARADRIGRNIFEYGSADEKADLHHLLAETLSQGRGYLRYRPDQLHSKRPVNVEVTGHAVYAEDGVLSGALLIRRVLADEIFQEERRRVMERLREAIWGMQHSDDMGDVMSVMRNGLVRLAVPFLAFGVNVFDMSQNPPRISIYLDTEGSGGRWRTVNAEYGGKALLKFWQEKRIVYRRDLSQEDPYGEYDYIRLHSDNAPVRSVLDIPFAYGTLAVNSRDPNAFDEMDIQILKEMADALDEGFRRREDLQRIEDALTRAEAANLAKSRFLANMSHEIRTPMNGVLGVASLMLSTELTSIQREYVGIMQHSGEHLLSLINDILDFSKIEADHLELEQIPFDLLELLESASDSLSVHAQAKGIELPCVVDLALRRPLVGDPAATPDRAKPCR